MSRDDVNNAYFDWLFELVCEEDEYSEYISYRKLLMHLHATEFTYVIPKDENRAEDGLSLRYRFAHHHLGIDDVEDCLTGPCSVFEMMVALANRCEETIMDDPNVGNRTGQWFWGMITNLGLGAMTDAKFDKGYVNEVMYRFLNREYERDGRGGLFRVRHPDHDLRDMEIFHQLCRYLGTIT
jgi:hypothetical protein